MSDVMVNAIAGGVLIGAAAAWLYLSLGRIAGISGIVGQALRSPGDLWQLAFLIGLGIGGLGTMMAIEPVSRMEIDAGWLIAAGLTVGFGTRLGSGCTSGHGVCGIARISRRSIVATAVFVGTGMATATFLHASGLHASGMVAP